MRLYEKAKLKEKLAQLERQVQNMPQRSLRELNLIEDVKTEIKKIKAQLYPRQFGGESRRERVFRRYASKTQEARQRFLIALHEQKGIPIAKITSWLSSACMEYCKSDSTVLQNTHLDIKYLNSFSST